MLHIVVSQQMDMPKESHWGVTDRIPTLLQAADIAIMQQRMGDLMALARPSRREWMFLKRWDHAQ